MNFTRPTLAAAVLALLAASSVSPTRADDGKPAAPAEPRKDGRPVSSDEAAKLAIDRFEAEFKGNDESKKMNAIQSLGRTKNDLVTKRLGALLLHQDPIVRSAAAMILDDQYQNVPMSGELLRKHLGREEEVDVLITVCLTLGRISYAEAIPEMGEVLIKNENVFVKMEALKAFGKMKDKRALVPILDLWLTNPQGYSWEGGEVNVDTGASGDADQQEAERQYKAKYGSQHRQGAPPAMLKTYIQAIADAVEKITGQKIENCTGLMRWMVDHEAELGYKLPAKVKTTLKEFEDRAAKKKKAAEKK
jgi:HEAT repeat protein